MLEALRNTMLSVKMLLVLAALIAMMSAASAGPASAEDGGSMFPPDVCGPPGDPCYEGPTVTKVSPASKSSIRDRTPMIRATVKDAQSELDQADIRVFVDGREIAFAYDQATDRLSSQSGKLSFAKHTVKVVAGDADGNETVKSWAFKVVRR